MVAVPAEPRGERLIVGLVVAVHLGYLVAVMVALALARRLWPPRASSRGPSVAALLACVLLAPGLYAGPHVVVPTFALLALVAHLGFAPSVRALSWAQWAYVVAPIAATFLTVVAYASWSRKKERRGSRAAP